MSQFKMNQPSAASAPVPSRVAAPLPEANQLRKLAPESLLTLAQTLQLPANVWETREETRRLAYSTDGVARDDAIALSFEQLAELARVYGAALTCQFLLGDQVILAVGAGLTSTDVNTFRNQIKASRTVSFEIEIDKTKLLLDILGHSDDFRSVLYLFPSAFERLLRGSLGTIETELWGDELTAKVVVVLPSRDAWIDGPLFAVIGGAALDDSERAHASKRLDPERLAKIKQTRLDTLRWQENWVQGLTPAHLRVQEYRAGVGQICSSLATHVTNLVLLYIADRSFRRANNQIVASFSGEQERVEVELLPPEAGLDQKALENADTLEQLWEWVYDPQWAGDRLNLVQSSVAHDLQEADVADRWRLFRLNASRIFADLKLVWRSFIERRLDDYRSQVHDLGAVKK